MVSDGTVSDGMARERQQAAPATTAFSVSGRVYVYVAVTPPAKTRAQAIRLANRTLATVCDVEEGFDADAVATREREEGPIVGLNTVVTVSVDVVATDAQDAVEVAMARLQTVADTGGGFGFEDVEAYDADGALVEQDEEVVW